MPEIREQQLQEDDEFLILACDGIWENLSSQQVLILGTSAGAPADIAGCTFCFSCNGI